MIANPTLLFTDIEGSSRLWEADSSAMATALARHDQLLRAVIEAHNGTVFKTVGDAFCAIFPSPLPALAAASAAQRQILAEEWATGAPLRVRMALHSGPVTLYNDDFVGPTINQINRLIPAGCGGQVLVSEVTALQLQASLPAEVELRSLGHYWLKDAPQPERIFQLVSAGLPAEFAALNARPARPTNLPVQSSSLIGREREVAAISALLQRPEVHLVSLLGPGGTGKTRLSIQIASSLADQFDGVFFVPLAPISDPGLLISTIAQSINLKLPADSNPEAALHADLADQKLLLVLDNFEQIVDAAPVIARLIAAAPQVKILVSSRIVLRIAGEYEFQVPTLEVPDLNRLPALELLAKSAAIALFVRTAQAIRPDFRLTERNAQAVAAICQRLDGLPLALELAAARIKILSPEMMLTRLAHRLRLLTSGAHDLPTRQQTLRGTIDWSYDLLDADEKILFARLMVLVGGGALEAVEALCDPAEDLAPLALDVLDGLASLVDKSLISQDAESEDEPRFTILETIREYGLERLRQGSEEITQRQRHAAYFCALTEQAEPELSKAQAAPWLQRLAREFDNIRAAIQWAVDSGDLDVAGRLLGSIWTFCMIRGHVSEARAWAFTILNHPVEMAPLARAQALTAGGWLARSTDALDQAETWFLECLELRRQLGDGVRIGYALKDLGGLNNVMGRKAAAIPWMEQALAQFRALGDQAGVADVLFEMGLIYVNEANQQAEPLFRESLALFRTKGDLRGIAHSTRWLGVAITSQGRVAEAQPLMIEGLRLNHQLQDRFMTIINLESVAWVAMLEGRWQFALRLFGAAESERKLRHIPESPGLLAAYARASAFWEAQVAPQEWQSVRAAGQAQDFDQVVAELLSEQP